MKDKVLEKWFRVKTYLEETHQGRFPYALVAISCVVGLVVAIEAWHFIAKSNPTISTPRYLIAVRKVGVGRTVTPLDFDFILQTDVKAPPEDAISDQYLDKLSGAKIKLPVDARQILTWAHVAARNDVAGSIPKGLRAFQLNLKNSVPLMGGDFVDIMAVPKGKALNPVLLLDKILVVEASKERESIQILLAIEPSDVAILEKAQEVGEVRLVLRNPDDLGNKRLRKSNFLNKKSRIEISEG